MVGDEVAVLLGEIQRTQDRTRSRLAELFWMPWVVYGILSLLAVPVIWRFGESSLGVFWALAMPATGGFTGWWHRRLELRLGMESRIAPMLLGAGVIALGAFGTGAAGGVFGWPMLSAVGPALSIAAGLSVFAVMLPKPDLFVAAGTIAVSTGAVLVAGVDPASATVLLLVVCGLAGIAVGVSCLRVARRVP